MMKKVWFPIALVLGMIGVICLAGCSVPMEGAGEWFFGVRNDNVLIWGHKVDGDKVGNKAVVGIKLEKWAQDAISRSDKPDENASLTPDNPNTDRPDGAPARGDDQ